MALLEISAPAGGRNDLIEDAARSPAAILDITERLGSIGLARSYKHVPGWPAVDDVKLATAYGPTGVEYSGTYSPGGGAAGMSRGRVVNP